MQKSTKKNHKKCLLGKKCLKPAISKRPPLRPLFSPPSLHIFVNIFYICLKLFRKMLKLILEPILGSERPKRAKMNPRGPSRASKSQKNNIFKKVVFALDIHHFFVLRASQKRIKRPKKAPKRHPKNSKTPKKGPKIGPKKHKKLDQFWSPFWKKKRQATINQKKNNFWDPLPPHLRGPNNAPPKSKREVLKSLLDCNYTQQKKGRDKAL